MKKYTFPRKMTVRQMQVGAALCLWKFCLTMKINHTSIDELLCHLFSVATAEDLAEWDTRGSLLAVTGRGDPIPEIVLKAVPEEHVDSFQRLLESCVEVGIVDLYGASTGLPAKFFGDCIRTLQREHVEVPNMAAIQEYCKGAEPWGEPVQCEELNLLLRNMGYRHPDNPETA